VYHLIQLYRLLSGRRRRQLLLTFGVMLAGALAEMLTIGAALSFLLLLSGTKGVALPAKLKGLISVGGLDTMVAASFALISVAVLAAVIRLVLVWLSGRLAGGVGLDIAIRIFSRTLRQPYIRFVQQNSSEVLAALGKIQLLVSGMLLPALQFVVGAIVSFAIAVLLFFIHPMVATIVTIVVGLSYVLVSMATRTRLRRNGRINAETVTARTKIIQEGIGGIRDIILDQSQPVFERQYAKAERRLRRVQSDTNFIASAPRFVVEGAGIIALVLVALIMSRQRGGLAGAIPIIGALALGAQRLLPLLQQAYWGLAQMRGNQALLVDLIALMEQPVAPVLPRSAATSRQAFATSVSFDHVWFEYQATHFALKDVTVIFERGSRIGITGATGSGKSTFLDLLMGLLDPTRGEIRIDGEPLNDANRSIWQAQIAHVPQSIYLADDSIAANIAFGIEGPIDQVRMRAASEAACLAPFLATLAQGAETRVGERGIRLSGGQRQRIGLARALYKGASVLILDEATSALDDATEAAVMRSLDALGDQVTVIMVAHRKSTLTACNRILRIEKGCVVDG
jgi:ABC-type multidrug transport system fused ATPase/permease subunit